jgi:hypothetical protein
MILKNESFNQAEFDLKTAISGAPPPPPVGLSKQIAVLPCPSIQKSLFPFTNSLYVYQKNIQVP